MATRIASILLLLLACSPLVTDAAGLYVEPSPLRSAARNLQTPTSIVLSTPVTRSGLLMDNFVVFAFAWPTGLSFTASVTVRLDSLRGDADLYAYRTLAAAQEGFDYVTKSSLSALNVDTVTLTGPPGSPSTWYLVVSAYTSADFRITVTANASPGGVAGSAAPTATRSPTPSPSSSFAAFAPLTAGLPVTVSLPAGSRARYFFTIPSSNPYGSYTLSSRCTPGRGGAGDVDVFLFLTPSSAAGSSTTAAVSTSEDWGCTPEKITFGGYAGGTRLYFQAVGWEGGTFDLRVDAGTAPFFSLANAAYFTPSPSPSSGSGLLGTQLQLGVTRTVSTLSTGERSLFSFQIPFTGPWVLSCRAVSGDPDLYLFTSMAAVTAAGSTSTGAVDGSSSTGNDFLTFTSDGGSYAPGSWVYLQLYAYVSGTYELRVDTGRAPVYAGSGAPTVTATPWVSPTPTPGRVVESSTPTAVYSYPGGSVSPLPGYIPLDTLLPFEAPITLPSGGLWTHTFTWPDPRVESYTVRLYLDGASSAEVYWVPGKFVGTPESVRYYAEYSSEVDDDSAVRVDTAVRTATVQYEQEISTWTLAILCRVEDMQRGCSNIAFSLRASSGGGAEPTGWGASTPLASTPSRSPTPAPTVSYTVVSARLTLTGLATDEALAGGRAFSQAVQVGVAHLLGVDEASVKVTGIRDGASARRALQWTPQQSSTPPPRVLVDFTVKVPQHAAARVASTLRSAFDGSDEAFARHGASLAGLYSRVSSAVGRSGFSVGIEGVGVKAGGGSTTSAQSGTVVLSGAAVAGIIGGVVALLLGFAGVRHRAKAQAAERATARVTASSGERPSVSPLHDGGGAGRDFAAHNPLPRGGHGGGRKQDPTLTSPLPGGLGYGGPAYTTPYPASPPGMMVYPPQQQYPAHYPQQQQFTPLQYPPQQQQPYPPQQQQYPPQQQPYPPQQQPYAPQPYAPQPYAPQSPYAPYGGGPQGFPPSVAPGGGGLPPGFVMAPPPRAAPYTPATHPLDAQQQRGGGGAPSTTAGEDRVQEERRCAICLDREKNTAFVPCGHTICSACAVSVQTCHMCRAPVEGRIRVY